jgi:hypothetical protein
MQIGPAANATVDDRPYNPYTDVRPKHAENARVVLQDVPDNIIPENSNKWNCSCDSDGCWPGCFTVASASILEYWSQKGFPNLWNGDEDGILVRLRELFPNLLCYGNGDGNGKPGDTGYDAYDVASGLNQFIQEQGYSFTLTPIPSPTFEQVMSEIDAGHPIIGAFAESPWGSHAGTIIGYDTTGGRQVMVVRPNLWQKTDTDLAWGTGYQGFGLVTVAPSDNAVTSTLSPQVTYEALVNASDPGFAAQGNWQTAQGVGMNGEARSLTTTDPTNLGPTDDTGWARWNPQLPFDGVWEVLAWMPQADTDDSATHNAVYHVTHAEGMSLVRRSQHDASQGWMSLGTFPFIRGDKAVVYLGNLTGDTPLRKVWADAVKFVWRAPLIITSEDDDEVLYLVQDGKRLRIPDMDTFDALRLSRSNIRKLSAMQLAQYPEGDTLPSIFGSWVGQYYNNTTLAAPASAVRRDDKLSFQWNDTAPAENMSSRGFSARWSRVMALGDGNYPFTIDAVGGVRLYVDGHLEINDWDSSSVYIQHQQVVSVTSGLHRVEVEYVNREGQARIDLGDLPPNAPIVPDVGQLQWTTAPTVTLQWQDGGDPDNSAQPRKYYVSVWRDGNDWSVNSEWITATEWTLPLPGDGRYFWRVSAGDGTAVSDWSPAREIDVDRSAPWAQMQTAQTPQELAESTAQAQAANEQTMVQMPNAVSIDASGQPISVSVAQLMSATTPGPSTPQPFIGLMLSWWATDTLSGLASFDVQARELVHAETRYTPTVEMHEVSQLSYELIVSGSQEITNALVITSMVPYTTVAPIMVYTPISPTDWFTFASGIVNTQTVFVGNPGSTYEFRVRARDNAGNVQEWLDGYSIQAQMDPHVTFTHVYIPLVMR